MIFSDKGNTLNKRHKRIKRLHYFWKFYANEMFIHWFEISFNKRRNKP